MELSPLNIKKSVKSKKYFSNLKLNVDKHQTNTNEEDKYEAVDSNLLVNIMCHDDIDDCLNEFIYKEKIDKVNPIASVASIDGLEFGRTRYVSMDSNSAFFEKYHKFDEMKRKGTINEKTPSMAFIRSCKNEIIVPNPVGIIKREGNDNELNLK